jgi:ABC-type transport system involved in multi-copper enzyme maturation permease subunit
MNLPVNLKAIYTIAKKEFMDNIRNKWILVIAILFIIMTMASSYLAGGQTGSDEVFGSMDDTISTLMSIHVLLVPLISILLGFSTIAGEAESGALYVVLSYPVKRIEVLLGKFLGLGAVLAVTPIIGFGLSGIIIAATIGGEQGVSFLAFIALAIILGLMYLSLIMFISSLVKTRIRAIAGGIILFFWASIYGIIIFSLYIATGGAFEDFFQPGGLGSLPDWFWASIVFSPTDTNQAAVFQAFDIKQTFGFAIETPEWLSTGFLLVVQFVWIIIPLILAYIFFKRRDI